LKKTYILLLAGALSLGLVACGPGGGKKTRGGVSGPAVTSGAAVSAAALGAEDRKNLSRNYALQISSGNYQVVYDKFNQKLKDSLSLENLKESWTGLVAGLDGCQGVHSIEEEEKEGYYIDTVVLAYPQNAGRSIRLVYDQNMEIAGIWFNLAELPEEEAEGPREEAYRVGRQGDCLDGVLTLPEGREKPALVLLFANEDSDQDGSIGQGGNKPLADLAADLADQGIASLRYRQRKNQYPDKISSQAGMDQLFLQDASQALNQIYTDSRIDKNRIFVFGMGRSAQWMSALLAAKGNRIQGAVLVGPKASYYGEKDYSTGKVCQADARYYIEKNSTIPLMVLHGQKDFETTDQDLEALKELWKGRSHVTFHSYKNLNHYLMMSSGLSDAKDYEPKSQVSNQVAIDIAAWLGEKRRDT